MARGIILESLSPRSAQEYSGYRVEKGGKAEGDATDVYSMTPSITNKRKDSSDSEDSKEDKNFF